MSIIIGSNDGSWSISRALLLYQGRFVPHPGLDRHLNSVEQTDPFCKCVVLSSICLLIQLEKKIKKKNPVSMGSLHHINSTPSLMAEILPESGSNQQGPFVPATHF